MSDPSSKLEQTAGGLRCAAASDVGMRRASNQDALAVALAADAHQWQSHGHLFLVADGMGAHAAGELASKMAADAIPHSYHKRSEIPPSQAIVDAIREANQLIYTKGSQSVDFQGMGTTCSCLLILPQGAVAAHVGDSRVYRLRDERFEQLTFDHSLVWEMAAAGHATEEEVPAYVPKNVITRSLGPHASVAVDVEGPFSVESGDRYLLCSDGLTGPLHPDLIGMVLNSVPLTDAAQTLIDLSNLLGGPDNITTVVVEVVDAQKLGTAESPSAGDRVEESQSFQVGKSAALIWVALLVAAIASAGLAVWGQFIPAVIAGAVSVGMAIWAWKRQDCGTIGSTCSHLIGYQGKAPYRSHLCTPGPESIGTLADIVRQLEDLEGQSNWQVDWEAMQRDRQQALEAITQGNHQMAVVAYCSAVRRLMQALRESNAAKSSDSTVDLA